MESTKNRAAALDTDNSFLLVENLRLEDNWDQVYDVLVIGAGISGLGAAHHLVAKGIKNIKVIEARDRIGGRIYSDNLLPNPSYQQSGAKKLKQESAFRDWREVKVDVGASWIHGIGPGAEERPKFKGKMNPLYSLTKKFGIKTALSWKDIDDSTELFFWYKENESASLKDRHKMPSEVEDVAERMLKYYEKR